MDIISNGKNLSLTMEEGQLLFQISATYALPEKLGESTYSVADRAISGDEVRLLYRELRSRSPLSQEAERWQMFGPRDVWDEVTNEGGKIGYKMKPIRKDEIVSVKVNDDILSGITWCILVSVHPASAAIRNLTTQEELLWPLAEKIKRTKILRESIGLSTKTLPKRWKSDDEFEAPKDQKEEPSKKPE
jgi:hypothetical protein